MVTCGGVDQPVMDLDVWVEGAKDSGGQGGAGAGEGPQDPAGFGGCAVLPVGGDDPGKHHITGRVSLVRGDGQGGGDRDGVRVVGVQRPARRRYRPAALVENGLDQPWHPDGCCV